LQLRFYVLKIEDFTSESIDLLQTFFKENFFVMKHQFSNVLHITQQFQQTFSFGIVFIIQFLCHFLFCSHTNYPCYSMCKHIFFNLIFEKFYKYTFTYFTELFAYFFQCIRNDIFNFLYFLISLYLFFFFLNQNEKLHWG